MPNLDLIEHQPHWRIWLVAKFSRLMGVTVHVEGIPFGSGRLRKEREKAEGLVGSSIGETIPRDRLAIETARADDNGRSCAEFCRALQRIAQTTSEDQTREIALTALRMPWLWMGPGERIGERNLEWIKANKGAHPENIAKVADEALATIRG
ncbi:hypothetical protein [Bradyrhizobium sp. 141]|uniref:hypothetical protein n=1 Tax=Bradyrhizobium sp. 141 TaxID=2782617 RepID=UPI001FFBB083|nr:hypothetical protein [Bradyrhizobium sp. 141]MCK1718849.1 hypothetical protein [Bradyrhizobium sp. 141]